MALLWQNAGLSAAVGEEDRLCQFVEKLDGPSCQLRETSDGCSMNFLETHQYTHTHRPNRSETFAHTSSNIQQFVNMFKYQNVF